MEDILINFVVGAGIFAISWLLASLFMRKDTINRVKFYIVLSLAIAVIYPLQNTYVQPRIKLWHTIRTVDEYLSKEDPYSILHHHFPDDYDKIRAVIIASLENNDTRDQAFQKGRPVFMNIMMTKIPMASDAAMTKFATKLLNDLNYFHNQGNDDYAFRFLFDQKNMPRDWYESLPKEMRDSEKVLYREILLSAAEHRAPDVDAMKAKGLLEKLNIDLYNKYGNKILLLQNPLSHQDNKVDVVKVTIAFYDQIMKLSEDDRGVVLRYLFSSQN